MAKRIDTIECGARKVWVYVIGLEPDDNTGKIMKVAARADQQPAYDNRHIP